MSTKKRIIALAVFATALVVGPATRVMADDHIVGTITSRLATGFIMQTDEGTPVTVAITETTKLKVDDGPGRWEASELVPGLRVKIEGSYDANMTFAAHEIKFSQNDRKLAMAIKSGLVPTNEQVQRNRNDIDQHGRQLGEHGQALDAHGRALADHGEKIVATTGAVVATNNRIGKLENYTVVDKFTVLFKNGHARVPAEYVPQLAEFANKAKGVEGYKLQVEGFASAVGKPAYNTMLSHNRAEAVTFVLQQQGGIPAANMFVPAAMGTTEQVADNKTAKGQAQNRRVVVTILQNTGITEKVAIK